MVYRCVTAGANCLETFMCLMCVLVCGFHSVNIVPGHGSSHIERIGSILEYSGTKLRLESRKSV